jgi:predicted NodU family carbamoyl transferase
MGSDFTVEDIVAGLCDSLVKNYLNNVCRGKEILSPIVFQGGVAANRGIQKALEKELEAPLIIPKHFDVMGAIGAAKLVKRAKPPKTKFRGLDLHQNPAPRGDLNAVSADVFKLKKFPPIYPIITLFLTLR